MMPDLPSASSAISSMRSCRTGGSTAPALAGATEESTRIETASECARMVKSRRNARRPHQLTRPSTVTGQPRERVQVVAEVDAIAPRPVLDRDRCLGRGGRALLLGADLGLAARGERLERLRQRGL